MPKAFLPPIIVSPQISSLIHGAREVQDEQASPLTVFDKVSPRVSHFVIQQPAQIRVGRQCKLLLEIGRAQFLQALGYSGTIDISSVYFLFSMSIYCCFFVVKLVKYTHLSKENILLIAVAN